jgi:hypothetical protein
MAGNYDPLHDVALVLGAVMQIAGAEPRTVSDPLLNIASRLGFTHRTDPAEVEDLLRGAVERRVRQKAAQEILDLAEADRAFPLASKWNRPPYGDTGSSLRKLSRGQALPRPEDLRGGRTRA